MSRIKEWISIKLAKSPRSVVLGGILLFNIVFLVASAFLISALSLKGTENMGFFQSAYYTITMVLDAGCIEAVVGDIGTSGVAMAVACLVIVFIGMITFTGAVIGYVTNWISSFIENANTGSRKLHIKNHTVILNWNTRASEIINDLLYNEHKEKVIILVNSRKEEIKKEIEERLSDTIEKENMKTREDAKSFPFYKRINYLRKNRIRKNVTYIVREGDVFSLKQLNDISLDLAKAVIILGNDVNNSICKYENKIHLSESERGNSQTIKTLIQVADITAAETSADKQRIIVEITDMWTYDIVKKIIRSKQVNGKCNIVPVFINQILGQILSQFSLMPELNLVYKELFSNKGAAFFAQKADIEDETEYLKAYLQTHQHAIPLTSLKEPDGNYFYYVSSSEKSVNKSETLETSSYQVKLNNNYWIEKKNVIVLGHNSDSDEIMKGFASFACEWDYTSPDVEILRVTVIDDKEHLEKSGYYRQYPFVAETIVADIYDKDKIFETINRVITYSDGDTSILILSDDMATSENVDANALANLIYVQDIVKDKKEENLNFDPNSIDIIVEIIDPKHHDIVSSYDINNVVISNRYISKMITQIGEKEAVYDFYNDILTYDVDVSDGYQSKEIYVKKVSSFFEELPAPCKASELIRAVLNASTSEQLPKIKRSPTLVLGYVTKEGEMVLFSNNQSQINVSLQETDKLIVYAAH